MRPPASDPLRALLPLLVAAGCGGLPAPAPAAVDAIDLGPPRSADASLAPGAPELLLGGVAPDGTFLPLPEGADAELVSGAQGGFHVWVKVRLRGVPPMHAQLSRTAHRVSDDELVLRAASALDVVPDGPAAAWETPMPIPMFMCPSPIGLSVIDGSIRFDVALSDEHGVPVVSGSLTVSPRCPAAERDFCQKICSG